MNFNDYYSYLKEDGLLHGYIQNNVKKEIKKLDSKKSYLVSSRKIIAIYSGISLLESGIEGSTTYDLLDKSRFATNIGGDSFVKVTALEETYLEIYSLEDLIYFLEKEQLGSVFWLEMMQQQQRLNRINILDNKQRVHHIICFLRDRFGRELDLKVKLPKWASAKLISQISYTRLSFVRNLFADLSKEGVISKSEGCWEVMLANFEKVGDERRLNQR